MTHVTDGVTNDIVCIQGTRMPQFNARFGPEKRKIEIKANNLYMYYISYIQNILYISYMHIIYIYILHIFVESKVSGI